VRFAAFRDELAALGHVDGQNVKILLRTANGPADELPALIDELARLPVDVLVVAGSPLGGQAMRLVGSSIPVVMSGSSDPMPPPPRQGYRRSTASASSPGRAG